VETKAPKEYTIEITRISLHSDDKVSYVTNTLEGLVRYFSYILECGEGWSCGKGMKKVNINPKSINSLVTALNNSAYNTGINYQSRYYDLVDTNPTLVDNNQ
jgi:hypothetical protein